MPNFVLIVTDDQRWDTVGAAHGLGGPVMPIVTAELAGSGVTFINGAVTTPLCCSSRASTLTGKYAHNHGVLGNAAPNGGAVAFNDSVTLATLLHDAGYRCGLIGKYLNGYDQLSPYIPPGWDDWQAFVIEPAYFGYDLNENGAIVHHGTAPTDYSTDVLAAKAAAFISASVAQGKPFFLFFCPNAPHRPYTPAPRHDGLFASLPIWRPPSFNEPDVTDKPPWVQALQQFTPSKRAAIEQDRIEGMETLQALDEAVGTIMQALRDAGVDDETLVAYTADNGFAWGEHRWNAKGVPYEEAIRVPMVVRYQPLVSTPRIDSSIVLNIDFFPTMLELAGLPIPAGTNGASLVPLLPGGAPWRADFLNEFWTAAGGTVPSNSLVRDAQHKYVEYTDSAQGTELYDLVDDPFELVNKTNDPQLAQVKAGLAARLLVLKGQ